MDLFISITATLLCLPWPGLVLMSPMAIAAEGFAGSKTSIMQAMVLFIYPSFVFLLLKAVGFSFYGTDPVRWAAVIFVLGMLISLAYRLPQRLYNLYQGVSNYGYHIGEIKVYFNGDCIKGADAATFVHYDNREFYSKDKNHVYYRTQKLPEADATTFGPLANDDTRSYWHDKRHVYYKWLPVPGADGATIRYLGHQYACDKTQVFYENKILPGADTTTFKPMGGRVGRDAYRVFVHALPADNVKDVASFETMILEEEWFGYDKVQVYSIRYAPPHPLLPFPEADLETFEVVGGYYARDKNRVYGYSYHMDRITELQGANPATFRLHFDSEKNTDATDGVNFYRNGILYSE